MYQEKPYVERSLVATQKLVTTAGTRVALSATKVLLPRLKIRALTTNTGVIYVGSVLVSSTVGYPLAPGVEIDIDDLLFSDEDVIDISKIYIDSSVNLEGVALIYLS
jgi:hypothetical protein